MRNIFSIMDLDGYAETIRNAAASEYCDDLEENLDDFITLNQVKNLIEKNSVGQDDSDHLLINEDIHNDIYDEICVWIFNAGLSKLAASGKIECAWCDDSNEMVFWASSTSNEGTQNDKTTNNRD